jgi:hypothetical protein
MKSALKTCFGLYDAENIGRTTAFIFVIASRLSKTSEGIHQFDVAAPGFGKEHVGGQVIAAHGL